MGKRILCWGPSPFGSSGYSKAIKAFGPRLAKKGFDIAYFGYTNHIGMDPLDYKGAPVFSATFEWQEFQRHFIVEVVKNWKPDLVVQDFDLYTAYPQFKEYANFPIVSLNPVDGVPLGNLIWECAMLCKSVVPLCSWGKKVYEDGGVTCAEVCYKGAEPETYHPRDKLESRKEFGIDPKQFVALMVMTNSARKNIPMQIEAFLNFRAETGADAKLIAIIPSGQGQGIPSYSRQPTGGAQNLTELWNNLKSNHQLDDNDTSFYHTSGLSEEALAALMCAADVLLQCPYSEGYGLPVIEAGYCGTPTIATNFGSLTELLLDDGTEKYPDMSALKQFKTNRGWLVNGEISYCQPIINTWQMIPSMRGITEALIEAYQHPKETKAKGENMRLWVNENCTWDKFTDKLAGIVTEVLEGIKV